MTKDQRANMFNEAVARDTKEKEDVLKSQSAEQKDDKVQFSIYLDNSLRKRLYMLKFDTSVSMSNHINKAIEEYLEKVGY